MSFRNIFRRSECAKACNSKNLKRDEHIAVWISVGVVFFAMFFTAAFGPAKRGDRQQKPDHTASQIIEIAVPVETALAPERIEDHLASFDLIWNTITARHWSPQHLEDVGWEAARDELRPLVETSSTDEEAVAIMSDLLDRLRLSHYQIIPAEAYDEQERASGEGVSGISVRIIDGQAVVFRVEPDSAAANAGVQTGWVIDSIEDRSVAEALERLREREEATGDRPGVFSSMAIEGRLRGAIGESLPVTFLDETDTPRTLELVLARSTDPMFEAVNLPPMPVHIRFEPLDSGVGYFTFSAFLDPMRLMPEFQRAVEASRDLDGLIIDLRGNLGGIIMLCNGIGGWLLTESPTAELGRMSMRDSDLRLVLNRRANPLNKPVAVIIDERSISSAEILAGGLKDTGIARIFGSTSAGMSLPSVVEAMPNGHNFQYAFANYISASGRELEKNGVEPDERVILTRQALIAGTDPALEAALQWIHSQSE